MSSLLLVEKLDGRIARLTINRPDKMNALNNAVRGELREAMSELHSDDDVRVVIITGAGDRAFIAGADISEFAGARPTEQYRRMQEGDIYSGMEAFPKPIIAMINGFCLGGGCELAMACDMRVAATTAKIGQPEINLGLIPGAGGTQRLPRLVGEGWAMRLILSGELIDGETAERIGLVEAAVPPEELEAYVMKLAGKIAVRSPLALQAGKESVLAARRMPLDAGLNFERSWFSMLFSTDDMAEGVSAFLEKRRAEFTGS